MFENPRRGRQARNFTTIFPKILVLKLSSQQIFSKICRWVPLTGPVNWRHSLPRSVFRGDRISSLPTNACSTENNIPLWGGKKYDLP